MDSDLLESLSAIAERSRMHLGASGCAVLATGDATGTAELVFARGAAADFEASVRAVLDAGCLRALERGTEPVVLAGGARVGAALAAPLRYGGSFIGVLGLFWDEARELSAAENALAGAFAAEAGAAMAFARLYAESEERASRLEIVRNVAKAVASAVEPDELFETIVREIRRAVPCHRCAIGHRDPQTGRHTYWRVESDVLVEPLEQEQEHTWEGAVVYRTCEPFYVPDLNATSLTTRARLVRAGLKSSLVVPVLRGDACIAHLALSSSSAHAFSQKDIALLVAAADHLGSAIENARLYDEARRNQEFFQSVFDDSADPMIISDAGGRITRWNRAASRVLGYREDDVLGREMDFLVPERLLRRWRDFLAARARGRSFGYDAPGRRRDGSVVPMSVMVSPIVDGHGKVDAFCTVARDLTEREKLMKELERKSAEVERFAYAVSHDLRSPLVTIKGFLGLLQRDAERGERARLLEDLARVRAASDTMKKLLDELLELSRVGRHRSPPTEVALEAVARDAAALVGGAIAERGVRVDVRAGLPAVRGDRQRLLQLFQNLVENAVKFMGEQPEPRVEIGSTRSGGEVICYVQDNGIGVAPAMREKVFEPFRRAGENGEGSGMGLTIVKQIVEQHGGRIWIEPSETGAGTRFNLVLPGMNAGGGQPGERPASD